MSDPDPDLPDARDGLTRKERIVLVTLARLQRESNGRPVKLAQLYGHVLAEVDLSQHDLMRIVQRLAKR